MRCVVDRNVVMRRILVFIVDSPRTSNLTYKIVVDSQNSHEPAVYRTNTPTHTSNNVMPVHGQAEQANGTTHTAHHYTTSHYECCFSHLQLTLRISIMKVK